MFAPKPAICGNGHAAMQRTYDVDKHLMVDEMIVDEKKTPAKQADKTKKPKPKH